MDKKHSIYSKIRDKTLLISVVSVLFIGFVAFAGVFYMRNSVMQTNEKMGISAAEDSKEALLIQAEYNLSKIVKSKAAICDEKLSAVAALVNMIADQATEIIVNPHNYGKRDVSFPNPKNHGTVVSQLYITRGVPLDSITDEMELVGNVQDLLVAICANSENVGSVYVGMENGFTITADMDSALKSKYFNAAKRPWYLSAKEKKQMVWTDVYEDSFGRGQNITCAMPFYGATGEIRGVAGIDMTLEKLNEIVSDTKIGRTDYAFIVNEMGEVIISESLRFDERGKVARENLLESDNIPREIVEKMIDGQSGFAPLTINGTESVLVYEPLNTLPWSFVIAMNFDEIIEPALESEKIIIQLKNDAMKKTNSVIMLMAAIFAALFTGVELVNIVLTKKLAKNLADPIITLSKEAKIIGSGNLDYKLDIKTGDEVETLAVAFNTMIDSIKKITAEKERIGAELNVATEIQANMLPSIFPPFPDREEFEIFASMQPAREVGGDFYDFFLIDDDHLGIVIADVSGKSVPAALFMVIAKTLINNRARNKEKPREVFTNVNNQLCEGNESSMFVTAWFGILEISTGKMTFANAGHNPPLLKKHGGQFEYLETKKELVLAGIEDFEYSQLEMQLEKGDVLYLYTDGVTEATNSVYELYGEVRLKNTLNGLLELPVNQLLPQVKEDIDTFAGSAPQFDDITMLALQIKV